MNKTIKKIACIIILLICLMSLCSCRDYFYYDYETLIETVESVEIIEYTPYPNEEEVWLVTIDPSEQDQFLFDLSLLTYTHIIIGDPSTLHGTCIKLNYTNGESEIIGYMGTSKHILIHCDKAQFEKLIQKYLG